MNKNFYSLFSLWGGLLIILFVNSAGCTTAPSTVGVNADCGEWVDESNITGDNLAQGITVQPARQQAVESDCHGIFTLTNEVGYSLSLREFPYGAKNIEWLAIYPKLILVPGLPVDIKTVPSRIDKDAFSSLQGEISIDSAGADASLWLFGSILDLLIPPICPLPSAEDSLLIAMRLAPIWRDSFRSLFTFDILSAKRASYRAIDAYFEQAGVISREYSYSCIADVLERKGLDKLAKANLAREYWEALGQPFLDYLRYGGPAKNTTVVLAYIPSSSPELAGNTEPQEEATEEPPVIVDGNDQCNAEKWSFKPIALYRFKGISNGHDLVILDFSVHNGGDYPGGALIEDHAYLITDTGRQYKTMDNLYNPVVPNDPPSPYSGTEYRRWNLGITEMIAPGAAGPGWIDPRSGKVFPYTFAYEIPSSEKLVALQFEGILVQCQTSQSTYRNTEISSVRYPLSEDLITGSSSLPSDEPIVPPATMTPLVNEGKCDAEITITSVNEFKVLTDMKLVFVTLEIQNTGSYWMQIKGPEDDWLSKQTEPPTYLTTEDGATFGYSAFSLPSQVESLPNELQATYHSYAGWIVTGLMPPGFVTRGSTYLGESYYHYLAFQIPETKTASSITIGEMRISCITPDAVGGRHYLPEKTYGLATDVSDISSQQSSEKYPNLVGSKLELPDGEGSIEFVEVTRNGSMVSIILNFTNLGPYESTAPFNGYLIGDSALFTCQERMGSNCEFRDSNYVPSGETQTLSWTFNVPENETNLMFVYVYGDYVDVNEVYRIDSE